MAMGAGRGRGPGWSLGLALRALVLAAVVAPVLPGSLEALGGTGTRRRARERTRIASRGGLQRDAPRRASRDWPL